VKYKARFVACGYNQIEGVDYFDTYASVMNGRILLALYNSSEESRMQHWL